jgi:hypothetical protein
MITLCYRPVFDCDYTTKTCLRGVNMGRSAVLGDVMDGGDRTTVLRHVWCTGSAACTNLDTGEVFVDTRLRTAQNFELADQLPQEPLDDQASFQDVVEAYRNVHQMCPNFSLDQLSLPDSIKQAIERGAAARTN